MFETAQNWPMKKKMYIACILILDSLAATLASSIFSTTTQAVGQEFHQGQEVVTLGTSLFVLGYALGPIMFAPMSELYGRRLPIILAAFAFGIFNIGCAVAKDYQTLMLCRFFAGIMGSGPLTIVAAVFSDMFNNESRGVAVAVFSASVFLGPFCGPFVGGFIVKSYLGWRWVCYIPAFMGFAACALAAFFQEESYGPVILVSKASELRRKTRNWGIHAKQEEIEVDLKELLSKNLSRPLRILFTEPIVLLITIYMSFIYGLLYLSLTSYELIFGEVYGFSLGVRGLPYIGMITGVMIGLLLIILMNKRYVKQLQANNDIPVPEWRLPIAMVRAENSPLLPRMSLTPLAGWRYLLQHRALLARLDWLHWECPVDRANSRWPRAGLRHLHRIPAMPELHHRRVPHVRSVGHCGQHHHAVVVWRHLSAFRHLHVRGHRHQLESDAAGVRCGPLHSHAFCPVLLWQADSGKEQVRAGPRHQAG